MSEQQDWIWDSSRKSFSNLPLKNKKQWMYGLTAFSSIFFLLVASSVMLYL